MRRIIEGGKREERNRERICWSSDKKKKRKYE